MANTTGPAVGHFG